MAIPTPSSSLRIARRRLRDFRERESCLGETLGEVRGVLENGWADWAGNAGGVLGFLGKMSLAPVSVVVTCWMDGGQINKSHEPIKGRTFVKVGVFFFSPWKRDTTDDDFHGKFVASLGADWHTWLDDGWWSFLWVKLIDVWFKISDSYYIINLTHNINKHIWT